MSDQIKEGTPASNPPPPPTPNRKRQYWLGIAYGAIPLVIFLISDALLRLSQYGTLGIVGTLIGLVGYLALLAITIAYLFNHEKRFIGYGMLTILLVTPVVAVYGCMLILQNG